MSRRPHLLAPFAVAVIAAGAIAVRAYRKALGRAREAAQEGSAIALTAAGPVEFAERGAGAPLISIHGAGGGFDQGNVRRRPRSARTWRISDWKTTIRAKTT